MNNEKTPLSSGSKEPEIKSKERKTCNTCGKKVLSIYNKGNTCHSCKINAGTEADTFLRDRDPGTGEGKLNKTLR